MVGNMINLRYSVEIAQQLGIDITSEKMVRRMGVYSWEHITMQPIFGEVWYWGCKVDDEFNLYNTACYIRTLNDDPRDYIGFGLTDTDAYLIAHKLKAKENLTMLKEQAS